MSFYLTEYLSLLENLQSNSYRLVNVSNFLKNASTSRKKNLSNDFPNQPSCILRHDVDRRPDAALVMARAEKERSIQSTYYFRCDRNGNFQGDHIAAIADMGHEIGYHYEDLSRSGGENSVAIGRFIRNLASLRIYADCQTVAMHGAPLSRVHNLDLLRGRRLSDFGLSSDASLSFEEITCLYVSDTGGKWLSGSNLRDFAGVPYDTEFCPVFSSEFFDDLRKFKPLIYLSTHPERWASSASQFAVIKSADKSANIIKWLIRAVRR